MRFLRRYHPGVELAVLLLAMLLFAIAAGESDKPWNEVAEAELSNLRSGLLTEVLGAWLTIRTIDLIAQRRERHHAIRQRLVDAFRYFLDVARQFEDDLHEFRVRDLQRERDSLEKAASRIKSVLSKTELESWDFAWNKLQLVTTLASLIRTQLRSLEEAAARLVEREQALTPSADVRRLHESSALWKLVQRHELERASQRTLGSSRLPLLTLSARTEVLLLAPEIRDQASAYVAHVDKLIKSQDEYAQQVRALEEKQAALLSDLSEETELD